MEELNALSDKILASEAYATFTHFQELETNYYVFHRNYEELTRYLQWGQSPEALPLIWATDKRREMHFAQLEIMRLLHNYVASAKMLVEHTRSSIRKWYRGTAFLEAYQNQVNERFKSDALSMFVVKLRDYALHYYLPITPARWEFQANAGTGTGQLRTVFTLDRESLLTWEGWKSKAREYLTSNDDPIVIEEFTRQYMEKIHQFQCWLNEQLETMHADQKEWLDQKTQRLAELRNKEFPE